jgi:hypothetical protein
VGAAVIDYVSPYLGEDVEQAIRGLRDAFAALKDFAAKFGIAIILPCRLPCRGGSSVMKKAIDTLRTVPDLHSVFLVEGTNPGTMALAKGSAVATDIFGFWLRMSPAPSEGSAPAVEWENSMPVKSAARHAPYTMDSRATGEIANTRNPDVGHETSRPGVVSAEAGEIPATPSEPSPPPQVASANSIEGAAATRETIPHPGASANVGKPVVALTKPLGRKPTVPVTPLFRKRVPGTPAPFSSVAAVRRTKNGDGSQNLRSAANSP